MCKATIRAWLLAIAFMSPWVVHAAGLGKLTVNSALGQPFKAEIDLVAVKKEEISSLSARLAPPDVFRQENIDYAPVFSTFKISVEARSDGQPYVKIVSSQLVADPFLGMLVELTWSSGRLLREYTVLLDPPEIESPRPVAPITQTAPAPVSAEMQSAAQVLAEKPDIAPAKEPAADSKSATAANVPASIPVHKSIAAYGPVKRGETLARIAQNVAPEGVDLNQMLVALHRANREAFSGNNMNRLKTGPILRVPEGREVATISPREANKEVRAQIADWNAYRQKLAAIPGAVPATELMKQTAAGRIDTTIEGEALTAKEPAKELLKLSRGEAPEGSGGKEASPLQDRIRAMEEESIARTKALQEANERVALLEKNIKEMQRLLELKNPAMAQAQQQAESITADPALPPVAAVSPHATATPTEIPLPQEADPASTAPAAEVIEPVAKAKPIVKKVASPPIDQAEPSFLDDLMENTDIEYAGGALALVLAGVIGASVMRRKKKLTGETGAGATFPDIAPPDDEPEFMAVGAETAEQVDEVDPLAEAGIYLAHGRDAQAEKILKETLARNPYHPEILAKLLEVYALRPDSSAFEAAARTLQIVTPSGPLWERAVALGSAIDPENPLYGAAGAVDEDPAESFTAASDFSSADADPLQAAPDLEFDAGDTAVLPAGAAENRQPPAVPDFELKFDLEGGEDKPSGMDGTNASAIAQSASGAESALLPVEDSLLGFDLDLPAAGVPMELPAAEATPPVEDLGLVFDLDFPAVPEASAPAPAPASSFAPSPDFILKDIDFNLEDAFPSLPTDMGSTERSARWHEVATKLDLAKAYQEMGDSEGAMEILQEVINEGDVEQQESARAMLAGLSELQDTI